MDLQLDQKIALVSASTAGIGLTIAKTLAMEGATVYLNGRTKERVEDAIQTLRQEGVKGELRGAIADLSTKEGFQELFKQAPVVDILVNNLGIYEAKPFEDVTDEEWLNFFEVNVLSGIKLSRFYLPYMKEKNWGRVVFISSESGINIPVEMIHYGMTKTAQLAVARGLAESMKDTGVTVNSILPGPTRSEGVERFIQQMADSRHVSLETVEKDFFQTLRPSSLIQRFASTEEVASLTAFVCSPLASAITGASLRVEGGILRSIV